MPYSYDIPPGISIKRFAVVLGLGTLHDTQQPRLLGMVDVVTALYFVAVSLQDAKGSRIGQPVFNSPAGTLVLLVPKT